MTEFSGNMLDPSRPDMMAHTPGWTPFDKEIAFLEAYESEGNSLKGSIKLHYGDLLNRRRGYLVAKDEDKDLLGACGAAWTAIDTVVAMDCKPSSFRRHCLPLLVSLGSALTRARGGG